MGLSKTADRFTSVTEMGELIRVFPAKKRQAWTRYIFSGVCLALGILVSLGGFITTFFYFRQYGVTAQNQSIRTILLPTIVIAVILFIIGGMVGLYTYKRQQKAVAIYKEGLAYFEHKGPNTLRWNQIKDMTASVSKRYRDGNYTGITHSYSISDHKGNKLVFDDGFKDVEAMAGEIRKGIFPHIYHAAATNYNNGNVVSFGVVKLSKSKGLKVKQQTIKWDDIEKVCIQKGHLRVAQKDGSWISGANASVAKIPNLDVLLTILDQVVGITAG